MPVVVVIMDVDVLTVVVTAMVATMIVVVRASDHPAEQRARNEQKCPLQSNSIHLFLSSSMRY